MQVKLNVDEKDWQVNLYIQQKKIAKEFVECRQHRLANLRQCEKEKHTNESVECRQQKLVTQCQCEKENKANESVEGTQGWRSGESPRLPSLCILVGT